MSGRVLDEVRASFSADMRRCFTQLAESAGALDTAVAGYVQGAPAVRGHLDLMRVNLHAVGGTAALVGAEALADAARGFEEVVEHAHHALVQLELHAARLRGVAALAGPGLGELRGVLDAELADDADGAAGARDVLRARLAAAWPEHAPSPVAVVADPPASEVPAHAAALDDGWADVAPGTGGGDPDDELRDTFASEAAEALTVAEAALDRIETPEGDPEAVATLARVLHQLKGAAASIGLRAAAGRLHELYALVGSREAPPATLDTHTLATLRGGLDAMVRETVPARATRQPVAVPVEPPSVMDEGDDEPRTLFAAEASRAIEELDALLVRISDRRGDGAARMAALARLERVFHRIKGSALVVGEPAFAEAAARGQELCEPSGTSITPEELVAVIAQLRARLPGASPAPAPAPAPRVAPSPRQRDVATVPVPVKTSAHGDLWDAFCEEVGELRERLDRRLAQLEASATPHAQLVELLRDYHTLKGAANTVGLDAVGAELHVIESFLERLSAARVLPPLAPVVTLLGAAHVRLSRNLAQAQRGVIDSGERALAAALDAVLAGPAAAGAPRTAESSSSSWLATADSAWSSRGDAPSSTGAAASQRAVPEASDVDRRFVRVAVDRLDGLMDLVGELVVWRSRMAGRLERLRRLHDDDDVQRRRVVELVEAFATRTEFANLGGTARARSAQVRPAPAGGEFGALELDQYEEIHVFSRQLAEAASDVVETSGAIDAELDGLAEDGDAVTTIVGGLRAEITRSRMVPLETLFSRLELPLRDAAERIERTVALATSGDDVAIDKAIADALFGPMLHLVRNAVAHGIEPAARRRAEGKPEQGRVTLAARQESGQIVLEISDDGAGIDREALRALGVARGLVPATISADDPAVLELIFATGVSTSRSVSDLSGRGVGCDVVRRAIERLNGTIRVTSEPRRGTTFTVVLPMTMSIARAVLARVGERTIAIPMFFAERIVEHDGALAVDSVGRRRLMIEGDLLPVAAARELFGDPPGAHGPSVVCTIGDERLAVQVDAVLGQEEIVVKPLGEVLEGHPLFAGATLRGDGSLALILDLAGVFAELSREGAVVAAAVEAIEQPAASMGALAPAPVAAPAPPSRLRVLFVDDSLSVRKVAERALRGLGVEVILAVDGQDALEKLRDQDVALVFTDLEMPRLHGLDLIRELRYIPAYQQIPIVVISSRSGAKHVEHATSLGADEYLTKPFTTENLADVIARRTGFGRSS